MAPLHVDDAHVPRQLITFLEYYLLLGVDHFIFYTFDRTELSEVCCFSKEFFIRISFRQANKILSYYASRGVVTIVRYRLPALDKRLYHYYTQIVRYMSWHTR